MAIPWGAIGAVASLAGTLISAKGQKDAGKAAEKQAAQVAQNEMVAAEFEAQQADYLAKQSIAISHREAYEQRRLAALLASEALAKAAGSGAGASDPTVVNLMNEIYAEGAYRSALAMYEGEERSRSQTIAGMSRRLSGKSAASAALTEGKSTAKASQINMFSTLLSGASSLATSIDKLGSIS